MTPLRIRLIGRFGVDGPLDAPIPHGRAARVLAVLAARHGRIATTLELTEALWPDRPPEHAERNVAALVSRLRRSLGRDRIEGDPRGYRLAPGDDTEVDVATGTELVDAAERELARGEAASAASAAEAAVALLGEDTPLADEPDAAWVQEVRRRVRVVLGRARRCLWSAALELGDPETAARPAAAALAVDPLDELAARALMTARRRQGARAAALGTFDALRTALARDLGIDPSPETRELFLAIVREGSATEPGTDDLVGRAAELSRLRTAWSQALLRRGGLVQLRGEPGSGTTTLCAALRAEVDAGGGLVVAVRCPEAERSFPWQPLVDAVRGIVAQAPRGPTLLGDAERAALATVLPELPPPDRAAAPRTELDRRRTLEAMAALLGRVAERCPVLITIDDLEHAAGTTVEALHVVVSRLAERRVLVVTAESSSEHHPRGEALRDVGVTVPVGPLSREAVATLLAGAGSGHDLDRFFSWTGGSPLLVSELLRHGDRTAASPAIPESLHQALTDRLASTSDDVVALLAQAAVLGRSFALDDVAAFTGIQVEECARRAERAVRAGFLTTGDAGFRFTHGLVRQIVEDGTPQPVLVSRHQRAAALFADRPRVAAPHHAAAGDHTEAAHAWLAAAEAAHLAFDHADAERLLGDALDEVRHAGDRALECTVLVRRGRIRCDLARYEDAHDDQEAALRLARDLADEELEAHALEALGWTALWARDAMAAVELAEQARHLAESAAAAPGAQRSSLLLLGRVRHWDGEYDGAGHAYQQVLSVEADDALAATAMAYRGALLQHMDRFAEARAVLERAAVLCARTGEFRMLLQSLFFCGLARGDSGDLAGALRALSRARRLIEEAGVGYYLAGIETTTSWVRQELGDVARAREHAETAVELARRGGGALELEQELHATLALADCELLVGRDDEAGALVEAAVPLLSGPLPFRPRATMRLMEMRARWEPERAEELLDYARRFRSTKYEALALAHLGRDVEADAASARTRSDLVVASVGSPAARRQAHDRVAAALPADLREGFVRQGRLTRGRLVVPTRTPPRG